MYTTYFGFREPPFLLPPNPRFLYATPSTQEVYTAILQGLREGKKCLLLTGEVGTGKTTLLHKLMDEQGETAAIAFVYHTTLTFAEIVTSACEEFALPTPEGDTAHQIRILTDFATAQSRSGKNVILLLDEAQDLQETDLAQLTSLLIPTGQEESPLQILLAGQLELEVKLQSPGLQSLRQAIDLSYRLDCLPSREVGPFIQHRLRVAGCERQDLFSPQAIQRVIFYSRGIPRVINVLCDNALQIAQIHGQKTITNEIIDLAAERMLLRTEPQPTDLLGLEADFAGNEAAQPTLANYLTSSVLRPSTWGAITLGILFTILVGLWIYQPFSPETQPTLVHYTPVSHEAESDPEEISSEDSLGELFAGLPQEVIRPPLLDNSISMSRQAATPLPSPLTLEHGASPEEPTRSQPADPSSLSSFSRAQTTKPTAPPQPRQKSPPTFTALTLQTPAITPPRQTTPRYRPLSDTEQALFQAVMNGDRQTLGRLLAAGVSPNVKSKGGWTPLMWAVIDGDMMLVRTLLDKGAAVNVENNRGMTPLMYAAWNGYADILQLFLDKGADAHARDSSGATALQYARDPIARFTRKAERSRIEQLLADAPTNMGPAASRSTVEDNL